MPTAIKNKKQIVHTHFHYPTDEHCLGVLLEAITPMDQVFVPLCKHDSLCVCVIQTERKGDRQTGRMNE